MNSYSFIAISIAVLLVVALAVMFFNYRRTGEMPETDYGVSYASKT